MLQGLIELRKVGVFASAVIKKRRYWPRHIDGAAVDAHMATKEVGGSDVLHGTLDGIPYSVFAMKEPDYVMKIMSTYGTLLPPDHQPETFRTVDDAPLSFRYTEPFANHYFARHCVDDHNNLRQGTISLEESWKTHRWEMRVFAFILGVIEVNVYNAFRYFVWMKNDQESTNDFISFRKKLAKALIENEYLMPSPEERATTRSRNSHKFEKAPKFARKFTPAGWDLTNRKAYQQYTCRSLGCKNMIRTYCTCNKGVWMCSDCHVSHVLEMKMLE